MGSRSPPWPAAACRVRAGRGSRRSWASAAARPRRPPPRAPAICRLTPPAAVVNRGVVDDLVRAGLGIDLDDGDMDLRRVREREVAELPLDVGHLARRPA